MLFVVHYSAEAKVRNEQFSVLGFGAEEEVLWLQITMYDPGFVNVFDGTQHCSYDSSGIPTIRNDVAQTIRVSESVNIFS